MTKLNRGDRVVGRAAVEVVTREWEAWATQRGREYAEVVMQREALADALVAVLDPDANPVAAISQARAALKLAGRR